VLSVGVWIALSEVFGRRLETWGGIVGVYVATGGLFLLHSPCLDWWSQRFHTPVARVGIEAGINLLGCVLSSYHWQVRNL